MILFARNLKQHSTPPPTPTNADRLRQYRQAAPVVLANGKRWKWRRNLPAALPVAAGGASGGREANSRSCARQVTSSPEPAGFSHRH